MKVLKKRFDYILIGILVFIFGIIPLILFSIRYFQAIKINGINSKLAIIELWNYVLYIGSGQLLIIMSPIIILIISIYNFSRFKKQNDESDMHKYNKISHTILVVWIKSSALLLLLSFIIYIGALILPTRDYFPYQHYSIDSPVAKFIFTNISFVLFSIFISNIGLIISKYYDAFYKIFAMSLATFVLISAGIWIVGARIVLAIDNNMNPDWFNIYNFMSFDSGISFTFSMITLSILVGVSTVVLCLTYKSNEQSQ